LKRVRRRFVWNIVAGQAAVALAAAMAGGIVLLVTGTQVVEWYWLAVLFGGSFLIGLLRTIRRTPAPYPLAQRVDARLELHDCLSSALYFRRNPGTRRGDPALREALIEQADALSRELPVERAAPIGMPRAVYPAAVLALVAAGLFGVRYGIHRSLDLRPPLSRSLIDMFRPSAQFADARQPDPRKLPPELQRMGLAVDPAATEKVQDGTRAEAFTPQGVDPIETASMEQPVGKDPAAGQDAEGAEGFDVEGAEGDRETAQASDSEGGKTQTQDPPQPGENSSLLEKMRDALANMMAKLKMQPPKMGEGQQQASKQKGGQQAGEDPRQGQKGMPGDGKQTQGNPSQDAQGDQQGGEQAQTAQGRTGEQAGDQRASEDSKSGIGKQDGDKGIREAEQLAAMGKISELLGKRQQNLTGEIMVEVPSGNQQLKTAYTRQGRSHSDGGGEIHRDEVPLVYQQYVQQYFEEIRKTAPPK